MGHIRFKGNKLDPESINALITETLVQGQATSKWWRRQSQDFLDGFMDTIRTSMNNGESLTQAITRVVGGTIDGVFVPGIMNTTRRNAGALAATSINAVSNRAALKTFQENTDVIKWVTQVSTLDNKTSDICIAYSGQTWDVNTLLPVAGFSLPFNGGPPRHFNCRSRLRPVTRSFEELEIPGLDGEIPPSTRASMDGQVPADITFDQWLKGKSASFQDDLLGPGRANLWRKKEITLTQLVDMRGNPMSLRQLEAKVGLAPATTPAPAAAAIISTPDEFVTLTVPGEGEKTFLKARVDKDEVLVMVDRNVLEEGWARDQGYIPPDLSQNTIGDRIATFEKFLKDEPLIDVGNIHVRENGLIAFGDGRHRSRVLMNKGMNKIPVTMSQESLTNLSKATGKPFTVRKTAGQLARERMLLLQAEAKKARIARAKAAREARKAKKAAEAQAAAEKAAKEAREKAAKEAREAAEKLAAEKAAREAAEKAKLSTSVDPDDVPVITDNESAAQNAIREFLVRNGHTLDEIAEHFDVLDLIPQSNPEIARRALAQLREKIQKAAERVKKIAAATAELPDSIPVFKTSEAARIWTEKHLINKLDNNVVRNTMTERGARVTKKWNRQTREYEIKETHDELLAWGKYDKKFWRVVADVTTMMSRKFKMRLPNYMGIKRRHPVHKFRAGKELASVHMDSDSLLLPTTITNKKKVLERANWQEISNQRRWERGEKTLATMLDDAKAMKAKGVEFADDLIVAIEESIAKKDFPFTVTSIRGKAFDALTDEQKMAMYIWDTIVHESGHRLHGQFRQRVDAVLKRLFEFRDIDSAKNRWLWGRQVSEYATENPKEFLAESFTRYMMGDRKRVYPPLRDLFDELGDIEEFGIENLSEVFKDFAG